MMTTANYRHEMIGQGRHEQEAGVLYPKTRLAEMAAAAGAAGLGALLLTPGPDLRYATGYAAHQLERLTCLAVPADGDPFLVVPNLELPAARASRAGQLDLEIIGWDETDDPYELVAARLRGGTSVGLADRMWALMTMRLRAALPGARQELASLALSALRARKDPAELEALVAAGCIRGCPAGCAPAAPSWRSRPTSATPSWRRATRRLPSPSSPPARTPPPRIPPRPAGCWPPATPSWWTSATPCPAATARTAPGPT